MLGINPFVGIIILLILCVLSYSAAEPVRYDNYRVYNVVADNEQQLDELRRLSDQRIFYFSYEPMRVGQSVQVYLAPEELSLFESLTEQFGWQSKLLVMNLQTLIDEEQVKSRADGFHVNDYNRIDDIYAWMDSLAVTYSDTVTRIKGGDTFEGRSIEGVKLSKNPSNPAIFIESNIHAAEWITSASCVWIINELLTSSDPEIQGLLDNFNWFIFPVTNPDGYEYSHTDVRLWRKTRSRQGFVCYGVDLNRNYPLAFRYGGAASLDDPCNANYAGTESFAEIESRTFSNYIMSVKDEIKFPSILRSG